jgi:hypothetical protein
VTGPDSTAGSNGARRQGVWVGLLCGAVAISAAAGGLWGGFLLGTRSLGPELIQARQGLQALQRERDTLAGELSGLRQDSIACERVQRIEQGRDRSVQEQLKAAQDARLALAKEVSSLKRVIRLGGRSAVAVQGLTLATGEARREFRYRLTLSQLIDDAGKTSGSIDLRLSGRQGKKDKTLTLKQLKGSKPSRLEMRLDRSQTFEGRLVLPAGFEPQTLTVVIEPQGDKSIASTETFPWRLTE